MMVEKCLNPILSGQTVDLGDSLADKIASIKNSLDKAFQKGSCRGLHQIFTECNKHFIGIGQESEFIQMGVNTATGMMRHMITLVPRVVKKAFGRMQELTASSYRKILENSISTLKEISAIERTTSTEIIQPILQTANANLFELVPVKSEPTSHGDFAIKVNQHFVRTVKERIVARQTGYGAKATAEKYSAGCAARFSKGPQGRSFFREFFGFILDIAEETLLPKMIAQIS